MKKQVMKNNLQVSKVTLNKVQNIMLKNYEKVAYEKVMPLNFEIGETDEHFRAPPENLQWRPISKGDAWGHEWGSAWFRTSVTLPDAISGKKVYLHFRSSDEALVFIDGKIMGETNTFHQRLALLDAKAGDVLNLAIEAYAGHNRPGCGAGEDVRMSGMQGRFRGKDEQATLDAAAIVVERLEVTKFIYDVTVLSDMTLMLDENSLRRAKIERALAAVFSIVDLNPNPEKPQDWIPSLVEACAVLSPLLDCKNGSTALSVGIVGHAHIDTAWLWPISETVRKCARTFSTMLHLMEKYPEFRFIQSQPSQAEMMKKEYPELFEKMKKYISNGRFEPNGGMYSEADCNVSGGEALVRQFLVGMNFTEKEYEGYRSNVLWLPDVFGYSAALPQILKGVGIPYFITSKIGWNDTTKFPYDTFNWRGIDGSEVFTHFIKNSYNGRAMPSQFITDWNAIQDKGAQDKMLKSTGYGDGGGGTTHEMIERLSRMNDLEGCPKCEWVNVGEYMQGLEASCEDVRLWIGELYLELHRGTYTSQGEIKRGNRKSEMGLRDAEFVSVLSKLNAGEYEAEKLLAIWKEVLVLQFHDILPGSSIARVNEEARAAYKQILKDLSGIITRAMSSTFDKSKDSITLVNTLSWERADVHSLNIEKGKIVKGAINQRITNVYGEEVLSISGVSIPSCATKTVALVEGEQSTGSKFVYENNTLQTPLYTIKFNDTGAISSCVLNATKREAVKEGEAWNTWVHGECYPGYWDNWDIDADMDLKYKDNVEVKSISVVADGNVQFRIRRELSFGNASTVWQDTIFYADDARIDFETKVDWQEKQHAVKASFPTSVLADTARAEIQYGHVTRAAHRNTLEDTARFETCSQKWVDMSESEFGVAVLNDCKYGFDATNSTIRLTLIKAGIAPDETAEIGEHKFTYSVLPHAVGFGVDSVVHAGYELNAPVLLAENATSDSSLITVEGTKNVIVESVKWAEEGNAVVIRLYEAGHSTSTAKLKLGFNAISAHSVSMLEENGVELTLENNTVELNFKPFEIKTVKVEV